LNAFFSQESFKCAVSLWIENPSSTTSIACWVPIRKNEPPAPSTHRLLFFHVPRDHPINASKFKWLHRVRVREHLQGAAVYRPTMREYVLNS
jgi:hypothetical protein